jgi:stearoyl-CoA desaturase (delta-9 desaturase)
MSNGYVWNCPHHRYCTHGVHKFRNAFWRIFTQNLTISVIPEEIHVILHPVYYARSDQSQDSYNAKASFFYCFLAKVNHQPITKDLSEADYNHVNLLTHN